MYFAGVMSSSTSWRNLTLLRQCQNVITTSDSVLFVSTSSFVFYCIYLSTITSIYAHYIGYNNAAL